MIKKTKSILYSVSLVSFYVIVFFTVTYYSVRFKESLDDERAVAQFSCLETFEEAKKLFVSVDLLNTGTDKKPLWNVNATTKENVTIFRGGPNLCDTIKDVISDYQTPLLIGS